MNPIFRRSSRVVAVASAALAMTFGAAYAADNAASVGTGSAPASDATPGWHGHGGEHGMMRQLEALHAQLKLTPAQEQKWQTALQTMKTNREVMRTNRQKMRQQFQAAQQQPILDLDAMHKAHQQIEQSNAQLHEQTATAWLAFYDSLNDQQKTTVSTAIKQHFARMEARHEKMRERWQQRHGAAASSASAGS
jgi:Spy/CpxP family protein refolding chaperone